MKRLLIAAATMLLTSSALQTGKPASAASSTKAISIQLVSPTHPVSVPANGSIPIQVRVTGVSLNAGAMGRKNTPGQGHYHFYVDCIPSDAYARADLSGCWAGATAATKTVFDLAKSQVKVTSGTHVLLVALAQNDHVLYRVPPAATVFTVLTPHISIQLLSPTAPVTVGPKGRIPIRVKVTGVTLDPKALGRANVPGEGHYHFYVDCIPADAYSKPDLGGCWAGATASPSTVFDLTKSQVKIGRGTHLLLIALAQNDHVLYKVPAASLVFTVR